MPLSSSFYQPLFQAPKQPSNMIGTFMVLYGAKNPLFADLSVDEPPQPRFHSLAESLTADETVHIFNCTKIPRWKICIE
jgi:hypothetical protein